MSKKSKKNKVKTESVKPVKKKLKFKYTPLDTKTNIIFLGIFITLAFLLYFQCLPYGYVLDDKIVLSENAFTKKGLAGIPELFSTDSFQGYFGEQKKLVQGGRYRPLSLVTFAIEYQFWGLNPKVSHFVNILIYGFSAFIGFITLRRLFNEKSKKMKVVYSISFMTALLFLVHPIHTEAIANIKGRDEIMAFLFSMLSFLYCLKYYDHRKLAHLILGLVFFFLGIFSKENTITFLAVIPFGILLFRYNKAKRLNIKNPFKPLLKISTTLFACVIGYLIMRYQVMGYLLNENPSTDLMNNPFLGMTGVQKFSTIMYTLFVYLKLSIIPIALTHDYYPYHIPISTLSDIIVILSIILHILLIGIAIFFYKKRPKICFAIGFYFICLSIVSNLVVDVGTFMNERFIFTASLGLCLLIVLLIKRLSAFINKDNLTWIPLAILMPVIFLYSFKTLDRVPAWENELSLNQAAIKVSKNSARSNSFMATALFNHYKTTTSREEKNKLLAEAKPYADRAVEIYPMYLNGYIMKTGIAAEQFKYDRDLDKLLATFKSAIRYRPDVDYITQYMKYLNGKSQYEDQLINFYLDVGDNLLFTQLRNDSWAVHYLLLALEVRPSDPRVKAALVKVYTAMGRPKDAVKYK
ncbi:MAG: hypothetical protein HKO66_12870 [Saprospiraceae bacterium]|nr:hypothetical protein [Bacteroidia bacterium]NNL93124.1 hypothetical protein [Saprospiraceae bacterium]